MRWLTASLLPLCGINRKVKGAMSCLYLYKQYLASMYYEIFSIVIICATIPNCGNLLRAIGTKCSG